MDDLIARLTYDAPANGDSDRFEAARELARQRRELERRAKQLGVACDKHDLTHALACGRCLDEARRELAEARELLREARGPVDSAARYAFGQRMSDMELMISSEACEKYAEICRNRFARFMDIQEAALFQALAKVCKQAAKLPAAENEVKRLRDERP